MHILFISDPLSSFKIHKDSTFAMMREAQKRGHSISACEAHTLAWKQGSQVTGHIQQIKIQQSQAIWYEVLRQSQQTLTGFDAVIMRKDPPFDAEYFYATHLLEQAEREGANVYNKPSALRNHPEKLSILEFPEFIEPTLVTRDAADIRNFHAQHRDIILKPLDGMGGTGIFRVKNDGLNLGTIIETLTKNGTVTVMVQKFIPEIEKGDKRILIIAGKPVPYCLARIPQNGEVRGNLAAGGKGVAQALSQKDLEIANQLGPVLAARGLLLIGLDVIGDCVTEINVTSPTCFQEITSQTDCDVAELFINALEQAIQNASQ